MNWSNPYMEQALDEAIKAGTRGEVPIGAVIIDASGAVIASQSNRCEELQDVTAHAEMLAIKQASLFKSNYRLTDCSIYVSLEPCAMCAAAISFARISKLYFAAYDAKGGGVEHGARIFSQKTCHHRPEIYGGILEVESRVILQDFFKSLR